MATPPPQQQLKGLQISSSSTPKPSPLLSRVLEISTPRSGGSSLTDDAIWKRLREAGFDEEAIKSRDKAALIAYITRLETEVCWVFLAFLFFFFSLIFVGILGFWRLCLFGGLLCIIGFVSWAGG